VKKRLIAVVLAAAAAVTCSDEIGFAPKDCVETRPTTGKLELLVTISPEFPTVPVKIYRGDIDNAVLVVEDNLARVSFSWDVISDQEYAATAMYVIGADTVLAVGSALVSPTSKDYEDATCFGSARGTIDLQLQARP